MKDLGAKSKLNEDYRLPDTLTEKLRNTKNHIEIRQTNDNSDIVIIKSDERTLARMMWSQTRSRR